MQTISLFYFLVCKAWVQVQHSADQGLSTVTNKHARSQFLCPSLLINFALVKLLRTATEEKVRERQRRAQSREGTLKYIAAWLSPKSFYKIFVTLTRFRLRQPRN